jgi:hypothetical protein
VASAGPSTMRSDFDLASLGVDESCAAAERERTVAALAGDDAAAASRVRAGSPIDQLTCDIASIKLAREALIASNDRNARVVLRYPRSRSWNDRIPVMLGCLFALQILVGFAALSVFARFMR